MERRTLLLAILVVLGGGSAVNARKRVPKRLSAEDNAWLRRYNTQQELQAKAEAALKAGDNKAAAKHATELLKYNMGPKSWNYGNIIYDANQILGLAALREGDIPAAKDFLLKAGKTPGSPQLDSFGPEIRLGQELLERGECEVVLEFLNLIAVFWATSEPHESQLHVKVARRNAERLARWKDEILCGNVPVLNRFA